MESMSAECECTIRAERKLDPPGDNLSITCHWRHFRSLLLG